MNNMLREVGKIYASAFRVMFQYPSRFLGLACLYSALINFLVPIARTSSNLLAVLLNLAAIGTGTFIGIVFIFTIYQVNHLIEPNMVWLKSEDYFWKSVGQYIVGSLMAFMFTLPLLCFLMFAVYFEGWLLIAPIWFLVFWFLSLGSISLGQQILLDTGNGIFDSSIEGLRMLRKNIGIFGTIFFVITIIGVADMFARISIGSAVTGVDVFSGPFFPFKEFSKNFLAALRTPAVSLFDFFYQVIFFPLNAIVLTFAYLRSRRQSSSPEPPTEN